MASSSNLANKSRSWNENFWWELPFWLGLLFWSLLPGTQIIWFDIESVPINIQDLVIIPVAFVYWLLPAGDRQPISLRKSWHYHLPILTFSLLLYAAISTTWSDMNAPRDTKAMLYTLILAVSGFSLGYHLIAKRSFESVRPFLWRVTVYLAAICLLYSAASFLSLGVGDVRSDFNQRPSEFGIPRVAGPLFASSTGYFILVPALAFAIQQFIQSSTKRLFKLAVIFSLVLTNIGLGSRGGFVIAGTFLLLLVFFIKSKKQAIVAVILMILATTAAAGLFFSKANTDRFQSLEDAGRSATYLTSFKIISNRSFEYNIPGSGYGSYWPWYITDVEEVGAFNIGSSSITTKYGTILYQPHSTFLLLIVELGTVGLLFFLFLWNVLIRLLFKSSSSPIFACGVFASGLSIFFDCFLFKNAQVNIIWWIFLFGALALNSDLNPNRLHRNYKS